MVQRPVRLIICVDGTWCSPDGSHGARNQNITNIYRIFASVQMGVVKDAVDGREYEQRKHYVQGIAANDESWVHRVHVGIHGNKCLEQICDVYQMCCQLGPEDEVWMFGFSRGAYVVRAVAGLLHFLWCLVPPPRDDSRSSFKQEYEQILKLYATMQQQKKLEEGAIHHMFVAKTQPPPKIRFVGVFDTVKAVSDENLYDISFNHSIAHMRHAVALSENRDHFRPETVYPNLSNRASGLIKRSIVQAWFVGAHMDMGGSNEHDGLALYPLQWMLIEAQNLGLCLGFDGNYGGRSKLSNPLHIVGLEPRVEGRDEETNPPWSCKVQNGVTVTMHDMRSVHDPTGKHGERYQIRTHQKRATGWPKSARRPFALSDGVWELIGYCKFAPQGTIIHPSVYLLLDEFSRSTLKIPTFGVEQDQNPLERLRLTMLGTTTMGISPSTLDIPNMGFWNKQALSALKGPGAIRILVCGNCGVGKSTLINTVFGAEVTTASDRVRGIHEIRQELTSKDRPDLIVHDSGGFEAGTADQFDAVEKFLKEKSTESNIDDRLHVIWFCIEATSDRAVQTATEKLFKTVSQHAQDVPIIVIATKKDRLFGAKMMEIKTQIHKKEKRKATMEECEQYAEAEVQTRVEEIKEEMLKVEGGRFDDCIAVDKDDETSIERLTEITAESFTHDRVRLLYIRAQVTRIDLKISLALDETMVVYKRILKSATGSGGIPMAASSNRMAAAINVCSVIINCFGLPRVTPETVFQICKANLLDDLGNGFAIFLSEGLAAVAMGATIVTGGMPFFLIPMAINIPAVVPATTRLFLMLACDLILVLTRAFQESVSRCVGQPLERDVESAAVAYKAYYKSVHDEVRRLVPRRNVVASFRTDRISEGIKGIVGKYRKEMEVGEPATFSSSPASPPLFQYAMNRNSSPTLAGSSISDESRSDTMDEEKEISKGIEALSLQGRV